VVGTEMRPDVDETADANYLELLRDNQYSPERIWTSESLRTSRFLSFGDICHGILHADVWYGSPGYTIRTFQPSDFPPSQDSVSTASK